METKSGIVSKAMASSDFPWDLGVFDAHCHPTDTMASIEDIKSMKAAALVIMSTRAEDQDLVMHTANRVDIAESSVCRHDLQSVRVVVPSFGWHPWFSHLMVHDLNGEMQWPLSEEAKIQHYESVLSPKPESRRHILDLPEPRSLRQFVSDTKQRLQQHPRALVGEVGLDKAFRIPQAWLPEQSDDRDEGLTPGGREGRRLSPHRVSIQHQQDILTAQLRLAGELQRAVSVHGVQAHGILFETMRSLWKDTSAKATDRGIREPTKSMSYPPRICLHSYSGSVDTMRQYLHRSVPVDFYFSFSMVVNFSPDPSPKTEEVIKLVRDDRILIESDLHVAGVDMDNKLELIARKVCEVKRWGLEEGVEKLARNWAAFIGI